VSDRKVQQTRVVIPGGLDLSDPEAAAKAAESVEDEKVAETLRDAAKAARVASVDLRILCEPATDSEGKPSATTGVIFQWHGHEQPWAPKGTRTRGELVGLMPFFQALLGVQLMANAAKVLEERQKNGAPYQALIDATYGLTDAFEEVYGPIWAEMLRWYAEKTGVIAELEAQEMGSN